MGISCSSFVQGAKFFFSCETSMRLAVAWDLLKGSCNLANFS
jgi:hypothetical protein